MVTTEAENKEADAEPEALVVVEAPAETELSQGAPRKSRRGSVSTQPKVSKLTSYVTTAAALSLLFTDIFSRME